MEKQIIITVGREYGSGGHTIAKMLAERFDIPYYNRNLIEEVAAKNNINPENIKDYDEAPRNHFLSRSVNGYTNSPEKILADMQFEYIKSKADAGDSFVVVGRCADYVLKGMDCLVSFFIVADEDAKLKRTMETRNMSERDAEATIKRHDRNRKFYYRNHTDMDWGNCKNYDMTINSTVLGFEKTADIMEDFIRTKFDMK